MAEGDKQRAQQMFINICKNLDIVYIDIQSAVRMAFNNDLFRNKIIAEFNMQTRETDISSPSVYSPELIISIVKYELS